MTQDSLDDAGGVNDAHDFQRAGTSRNDESKPEGGMSTFVLLFSKDVIPKIFAIFSTSSVGLRPASDQSAAFYETDGRR
jgi:hypothetical protein